MLVGLGREGAVHRPAGGQVGRQDPRTGVEGGCVDKGRVCGEWRWGLGVAKEQSIVQQAAKEAGKTATQL